MLNFKLHKIKQMQHKRITVGHKNINFLDFHESEYWTKNFSDLVLIIYLTLPNLGK